MGVVEPVFPEVDEYPSYRALPRPLQVPRFERAAAMQLDRYVRDALRATRTEAVTR